MTYAIETIGLSKLYSGGVQAVNDLSLKVKKGEVFGFLGSNGAGKTTSIKMMTGLLKPTSGEVLIEGEKIEVASRDMKRKIGLCPQDIVVWSELTCLENLLVIGDMYEVEKEDACKRAKMLLEELKLSEKSDALANTLSGGMQRRLNVAMAVIHDPAIIVLDEPSAGLDPQSRLVVQDFIEKMGTEEGRTVILTTHMMDEVDKLCERVGIVDHGKLLVLDTPEALKRKVGKGDVIEITLSDDSKSKQAVDELLKMEQIDEAKMVGDKIVIRTLDAVNKLPSVFSILHGLRADIANVSMRRNTLEDVFITLTGRAMRE